MSPMFSDGDRIIVKKQVNDFFANEVIVFKKEGTNYIKRIEAIPGQEVTYNKSTENFIVNGQIMDSCCSDYKYAIHDMFKDENVTIPNEHYFVVGDNKNESIDSRNFGLVKSDQFIGKYVFKYWPLFQK